jgi:hypothetical protein
MSQECQELTFLSISPMRRRELLRHARLAHTLYRQRDIFLALVLIDPYQAARTGHPLPMVRVSKNPA